MKALNNKKFLIPLLLLLVLLIAGSITGYVVAKYKTDVVMTDEISYSTQLADSFRLVAERTETGKRAVTEEEPVRDTVYLIPGTSVNLSIQLNGKSDIQSYLYIEVLGATESEQLTDDWTLLEGVTGKHGGAVYTYKNILDGTEADLSVPILKETITTDPIPSEESSSLTVCGYLLQINGEAKRDPEQAKITFTNMFPQS